MDSVCLCKLSVYQRHEEEDNETRMPTSSGELRVSEPRMWEPSPDPPSSFSFSECHIGNGLLCGRVTYQYLPINSCFTLFCLTVEGRGREQGGTEGEKIKRARKKDITNAGPKGGWTEKWCLPRVKLR